MAEFEPQWDWGVNSMAGSQPQWGMTSPKAGSQLQWEDFEIPLYDEDFNLTIEDCFIRQSEIGDLSLPEKRTKVAVRDWVEPITVEKCLLKVETVVERFLASRIKGTTKPFAVDKVWVPTERVDPTKPVLVPKGRFDQTTPYFVEKSLGQRLRGLVQSIDEFVDKDLGQRIDEMVQRVDETKLPSILPKERVEEIGKRVAVSDDDWVRRKGVDESKPVAAERDLLRRKRKAESKRTFVERFVVTRKRGETKPISVDRVLIPAERVDETLCISVEDSVPKEWVDETKSNSVERVLIPAERIDETLCISAEDSIPKERADGRKRIDRRGSRAEGKKPVEGEWREAEGKKPVEGGWREAEGKISIEGEWRKAEGKKPIDERRSRAQGKKSIEGEWRRAEGKKPVDERGSRAQGKKSIEGEWRRAEGKKSIEGEWRRAEGKKSVDERGSRTQGRKSIEGEWRRAEGRIRNKQPVDAREKGSESLSGKRRKRVDERKPISVDMDLVPIPERVIERKPISADRDLVPTERVVFHRNPMAEIEIEAFSDLGLELLSGERFDEPMLSVERDLVRGKRVAEKYGLFFPSRRRIILNPIVLDEKIDGTPGVGDDFYKEKPVYNTSDIINDKEAGWALEEKTIEVTDLFAHTNTNFLDTNEGSKVDVVSLKGCYVIIACFFAPVLSDNTFLCRALIALSQKNNCKIVIVAKMRQNWDNDKGAFDHFFSGFPASFLAIPFSDSVSRDYVANSLGLSSWYSGSATLVIGPRGEVYTPSPHQMISYGAACFPFSDEKLVLVDEEVQARLRRLDTFSSRPVSSIYYCPLKPGDDYDRTPISLAELLDCHPEDPALLQISGSHDRKAVPVSALDGKLVALYLCYDGSFMASLYELQQRVKIHQPQLEVVLVPLSVNDDPDVFLAHATHALQKYKISSWWAIPYQDTLCRTLWKICGQEHRDRLILLPYGDQFSGEILAYTVVSLVRSRIYPFTRQQLYTERLSAIRSFDLYVFLRNSNGRAPWFYDDITTIPLEKIQGKKILMYFDTFQPNSHCTKLSDLLEKCYSEILHTHDAVCFIFVPTAGQPDDQFLRKLPGVSLPHQLTESLCKALFSEDLREYGRSGALVSIGTDGRVCSRNAEDFLYKDGIKHLFECNLEREIAADVDHEVTDLDRYVP